jgi:hypothetical protein
MSALVDIPAPLNITACFEAINILATSLTCLKINNKKKRRKTRAE